MVTKMGLSLDELIAQTKTTRRGGGRGGGRGGRGGGFRGRGGGGIGRISGGGPGGGMGRRRGVGRGSFGRSPRGAADGVWTHDKFQDPSGRRGGLRAAATSGGAGGAASSKITVSNLHYGVSDADIIELFGEIGQIRYASVHYDRSGRSLGTADVVFERRANAQMAIQQYNGVPLDGRPMVIKWANPPPTASPVRATGLRQVQRGRVGDRRIRGGGSRGTGDTRGGGGGRGRGRGGRGGGKAKTPAPTAAELDAELDAYVNANAK